MSVSNGEKANETTFNTSFISTETDSQTIAKIDLNRTGSGAQIPDAQQKINDNKTDIDTNRADIDTNDTELADHETRISTNESDISTAQADILALEGDTVDLTTNQTIAGEKTFTNDAVFNGDLTVNGTTTTVNTATLDVTDKNITVNNTGSDATAEGAGLTVERVGTDGSFIYEDALDNKFKGGALGSETEFSGIVKDTFANLSLISTPSTSNLYFATDTLETFRSDGTQLLPLGSGGGGGGLDVFYTFTNEDIKAADFSTGNNATFLTAGSLVGTLTDDIVTPISSSSSLKYTSAAVSINDWIASPVIDLDLKQRGQDVGVNFWYTLPSASEYEVVIWDVTNSAKLNSPLDQITETSNRTRFSTSVFIPSTCTQIRWGLHAITEQGSGPIITLDDLEKTLNPFSYQDIAEDQYINFSDHAGFGSTNTQIPYFTTEVANTGKELLSIGNNSVDGFSITANKPCSVNVTYNYLSSATSFQMGFSLNSSQLTTAIGSINLTDRVVYSNNHSNAGASIGTTIKLEAGDILRPHTSSSTAIVTGGHRLVITAQATSPHVVTPAKSNMTDWLSFTPSLTSFGTTSNEVGFYRRVGSNIEIDFSITAGTTVASLASMDMPAGLSIDVAKLRQNNTTAASGDIIGTTYTSQVGANVMGHMVAAPATDASKIYFTFQISSGNDKTIPTLANSVCAPSAIFSGTLTVPIEGWSSDAQFLAAVPIQKVAYLKDVKASGVNGGSTSANTVYTRDLNTIQGDSSVASLSSNQFTLGIGEYLIEAAAPIYRGERNQLFLHDGSSYVLDGVSTYGDGANQVHNIARLSGSVAITASTTYEIRHWTAGTQATTGLGVAADNHASNPQSNEVYTIVKITKLR